MMIRGNNAARGGATRRGAGRRCGSLARIAIAAAVALFSGTRAILATPLPTDASKLRPVTRDATPSSPTAPGAPTAAKPAAPKPAAAKPAAATPAAQKPEPAKKAAATKPVSISSKHLSPKSNSRPVRKQTRFIILHTTEGAAKGSLEKLSRNGECHYVIDTDGCIYRIVDRRRVAFHCGRSMWNGLTELDNYSIGIEIVGYHDKNITERQYAALKSLLDDLKRIYKVPNDRILTHSMVAYGSPNRWQKKSHRGRKRCGMLLAHPDNRRKFGVHSKPLYDPDLRARRLVDADPELTRRLYSAKSSVAAPPSSTQSAASRIIGPSRSAWDVARDLYDAKTTIYVFPNGTRKNGKEITNWKSIPSGTRVIIGEADEENPDEKMKSVGVDGSTPDIAGDEANASTTFYFIPGKKGYRRGDTMTIDEISRLPKGTKVIVGYAVGGPVAPKRPAFAICGPRWNSADTFYYTAKDDLLPGNTLKEKAIPSGTMVFYKK